MSLAACADALERDRRHRCPTCDALVADVLRRIIARAALATPSSPVTAHRVEGGATRVAGAETTTTTTTTTTTGAHAPTVVAASPRAADGDPASSASPPSPAPIPPGAGFGRGAEPPAPGRARHARPG